MNKKHIDLLLSPAYEEMKKTKIVGDGGLGSDQINKTYRGQISEFGAALATGSLLAAVAFFSDQGSSTVDRSKLMSAIWNLIKPDGTPYNDLFAAVKACAGDRRQERKMKAEIIDAAIALKLAMNLYELVKV